VGDRAALGDDGWVDCRADVLLDPFSGSPRGLGPSEFGSTKRLNRRVRKQIGGLLIRGSEVRILPGASSSEARGTRKRKVMGAAVRSMALDYRTDRGLRSA
jgi:hypothetical protein